MTFTGSKLGIDGQVKLKMVSAISDQVKTFIAHSTTHADCQTAVKDLMS